MPCTAGGIPVTIDVLLVFVVLGMEQSATPTKPCSLKDAMVGNVPLAKPCSRYAGSKPSTTITTVGRLGAAYTRPLTSTVVPGLDLATDVTTIKSPIANKLFSTTHDDALMTEPISASADMITPVVIKTAFILLSYPRSSVT